MAETLRPLLPRYRYFMRCPSIRCRLPCWTSRPHAAGGCGARRQEEHENQVLPEAAPPRGTSCENRQEEKGDTCDSDWSAPDSGRRPATLRRLQLLSTSSSWRCG